MYIDSRPAARNDYDHAFTEVPATAKMTSSIGDQIGSTAGCILIRQCLLRLNYIYKRRDIRKA